MKLKYCIIVIIIRFIVLEIIFIGIIYIEVILIILWEFLHLHYAQIMFQFLWATIKEKDFKESLVNYFHQTSKIKSRINLSANWTILKRN